MTAHSLSAAQMARRLLHPGVLDESLRSGLFIGFKCDGDSSKRFRSNLVAEAGRLGALVVSLDLNDADASSDCALRRSLAELRVDQGTALTLGRPMCGPIPVASPLAAICTTLIAQSGRDLVLILGGIGHLCDDAGHHLLRALKAARDNVNTRSGAQHHLFVVGWDTDLMKLRTLVQDEGQAFFGATLELVSEPLAS